MEFLERKSLIRKNSVWAIALLLSLSSLSAYAEVYDMVFGKAITSMDVPVNQSRIMVFDESIENVSVGNPNVADIVILESRKLYILGKSLGSTNIVVWGKASNTRQYTTLKVNIVHDVDALKHHLHELFPNEKPEIRSAQGAIILSGDVSSISKVEAIVSLAKQFVSNAEKHDEAPKSSGETKSDKQQKVINLMQVGGPHQVMLEVKIAEVSRNVLKQLGVNLAAFSPGRPLKLGAVNGGSSFPNALNRNNESVPLFPNDQAWSNQNDSVIGPAVQEFSPTLPTISAAGLFASFLTGSSYFNLVIDASKNNGLAKILAEPTLTSLSGETAEFLSGGEFPVPMWSGKDDQVSVIFKRFGIQVKMLPTVLNSKRINLHLDIGVSELSDSANINFGIPNSTVSYAIPSLSTRSTNSTVELMDGQTIGVAGLISDKMRESINKFPGLGDIPVLGALFRSQSYRKDQTELVMFVTAHLAKTIDPNAIRLPTDAFKAPSDADFFLRGKMTQTSNTDDTIIGTELNSGGTPTNPKQPTPNYPDDSKGPTFGHQI